MEYIIVYFIINGKIKNNYAINDFKHQIQILNQKNRNNYATFMKSIGKSNET